MSAEQSDEQKIQQEVDLEHPDADQHGSEKAMAVLAGSMPWVISLLFHLGIFLILFFVVFVTIKTVEPEELIIPDAVLSDDPGGRMSPNPTDSKTKSKSKSQQRKNVKRQTTKVSADTGKTKKAVSIIGVGGASAGSSGATGMGMQTSGGGGPSSSFFGTSGGNAYNIVYVIDGSGSMATSGAFDEVKKELLRSISRLKDVQTFHVILYTANKPEEPQSRRLVEATRENKIIAAKFLAKYSGEKGSNPIPALDRAFTVLKNAKKKGRVIYLLSDGEFGGNQAAPTLTNEAVLRKVRALNKDKKVFMNTILFGINQPEAVKVMQQLAKENRGKFRCVEYDD